MSKGTNSRGLVVLNGLFNGVNEKTTDVTATGAQELVGNDKSLPQSSVIGLPQIRGSRDNSMPQMEEQLRCVLGGHEVSSSTRNDHRQNQREEGISTRKLPLVNIRGAESQQDRQSVLHISRKDPNHGGLGERIQYAHGSAGIEAVHVPLANRESVVDSAARLETVIQNAGLQGRDAANESDGEEIQPQLSQAKRPIANGVDGGTGSRNTASRSARQKAHQGGFNASVQFSADLRPAIKDALLDYLGAPFSEKDGVIANHSVRKDVLLNAGTSEGAIKGWQNRNHSIASEIHGVVPTDAPVQTKTFYHVTRQENAPSILEKGFDINKTRAQWMNDHAISFSPTLKSAMKYFSPNAGPNEGKFDHSKYAVLEAKVRGRKLSDNAAPAIGESSDPRDYTQRVLRRGYDWADRGAKYVYNPRAIVSVRHVLPEELTNSVAGVFHPDPLPKQYSALLNAAHAKASTPKVTPTLHGLFHRVN